MLSRDTHDKKYAMMAGPADVDNLGESKALCENRELPVRASFW
jgi:hypothetical protein